MRCHDQWEGIVMVRGQGAPPAAARALLTARSRMGKKKAGKRRRPGAKRGDPQAVRHRFTEFAGEEKAERFIALVRVGVSSRFWQEQLWTRFAQAEDLKAQPSAEEIRHALGIEEPGPAVPGTELRSTWVHPPVRLSSRSPPAPRYAFPARQMAWALRDPSGVGKGCPLSEI